MSEMTFSRQEQDLIQTALGRLGSDYLERANAAYRNGDREDYEFWLRERDPFMRVFHRINDQRNREAEARHAAVATLYGPRKRSSR